MRHYLEALGAAVKAIRLEQKAGVEDYIHVEAAAGLLAPEQPDRMVFDLDPGV